MLECVENEVECLIGQYNGLAKGLKGEKNLSYFVNSFSDQVEYIENLRISCDGQN